MLLIIGLDGATWDLLDPWMREGRLPHLARLCRRSVSGPLASTTPPATLPSWTTFMTGVNPGKHGIFDFTRRELGSYDVRFVNATFRKAPTVWKLLSDHGRRVCVLGLPGTYPPEPVNGCMISGFDTPVTTRADASFVFPPELAPLVRETGGFPFADFQEFRVNRNWYGKALASLLRGVEVKTRLAETLLGREAWDCFMILFGESDTVAHHFWKFHDPRSPRYDAAGAVTCGDAIRRVYEALDAAVGTLTRAVPDAAVLLASDHGFGGAGAKMVYLNRWLQEIGFQTPAPRRYGGQVAGLAKRVALNLLPAPVQRQLFRVNDGRWASRLESRARFAGIEWERTRAFSEELNYFPSLWLNLKGREPQGVVDPTEYDRVCDELCARAGALRDPEHGAPIVRRAWRRDELYRGPWVHYAPDIVLELNLDQGYSYSCLPSRSARSPGVVVRTEAAWDANGKLAGMSGSHRSEGMFALALSGATAGRHLAGVQMADMGPTILGLCGVRPPADFDGTTVDPVVSPIDGATVLGAAGAAGERWYGQAEEDEIAARLTDLGYLQ